MTVSETASENLVTSEEDRRKAQAFFDRGKTVADTGNFEYAIEMYLQGLNIDPQNTDAHQALRDISLRRKASGGKDLGMFEKMKLKRAAKDDKTNMLNAEKMLAYSPGDTDHMLSLLQNAYRASYYDAVMWIGPILQKANADSRAPDFSKFIALKNVYAELKEWRLAATAGQYAAQLRPDDMDLQTEIKNLAAYETMTKGKYNAGGSFRDSVRDADKQQKLLDQDRDIRSADAMSRIIADAEAEYNADPTEPGKLMKYVEALVKTENIEHENRAIELLTQWYERTKQFRFRQNVGRIRIAQMARQERALRQAAQANPNDAQVRQDYADFRKQRLQEELEEFKLWSENYPTDMRIRYDVALRLFGLERFSDAIPVFQQARSDPKYRTEATIYLGQSFLGAGFVDEAVDTLKAVIADYQIHGDAKSIDMYYWYGRSLEKKNDTQAALKAYSQVAQWDFNYRDVQARIKKLRTAG